MKRKRYSREQIVAAVKQHERRVSAADIARKLGTAEQTFYRWKRQYGGVEASEVRALKLLRKENLMLKRLVADLSLEKVTLQDLASKKMVGASPRSRRPVFRLLQFLPDTRDAEGHASLGS